MISSTLQVNREAEDLRTLSDILGLVNVSEPGSPVRSALPPTSCFPPMSLMGWKVPKVATEVRVTDSGACSRMKLEEAEEQSSWFW